MSTQHTSQIDELISIYRIVISNQCELISNQYNCMKFIVDKTHACELSYMLKLSPQDNEKTTVKNELTRLE